MLRTFGELKVAVGAGLMVKRVAPLVKRFCPYLRTDWTFILHWMSRAKNWCFTLNNYNESDEERLSLLHEGVEYLVYGREVGDSGTPHLQGYVVFASRKRLAQVKFLVGDSAHLEVAKGSPSSNREYCTKDGDFYEFGTLPASGQGTRTDIAGLKLAISRGDAIGTLQQEHFGLYLRYQRVIDRLAMRAQERRNWVTQVFVFIGPTGTGKTRRVHQETTPEELYSHPGGMWFDGYEGQEAVLFDDFGGSEFKLTYLLKLLDRYPMNVPVKGSFVNWKPKKVYITSNIDPDDWYRNAWPAHVTALQRRITSITRFENE